MIRQALFNLLFLVLGFGLCYLLFVRTSESPRRPARISTPIPAHRQNPAPPPPPKEKKARIPKSKKAEILSQLIASFPVPEVPRGRGRITGKVETEAGDPLPGVEISCWLDPYRSKAYRPPEGKLKTLQEEIEAFLARRLWQEKATWKAHTDAKGFFEVSGLPEDGRFTVSASISGYKIQGPKGVPAYHHVKVGRNLHFTATPLSSLAISVLLPNGSEPPEAQIKVEGPGVGRTYRWTPAEPNVELEPGPYDVFASAELNENYFRSESVPIVIPEDGVPSPLTLSLRPLGAIKGEVIFQPDQIPDNAYVLLSKVARPEPVPIESMAGSSKREYLSPTTGDSAYLFKDLTPGLYYLAVALAHNSLLCADAFVEVQDHTVIKNIEVPPLDPSRYIVLYAYSPRGKLLRDITLQVYVRGANFGGALTTAVIKKSDNSSLVVLPEDSPSFRKVLGKDFNKESMQYFLQVRSPKYGTKKVPIDPRTQNQVEVAFVQPAVLHVTVTGYERLGYDRDIWLTLQGSEPGSSAATRIRAPDKSAAFSPVEPGSYILLGRLSTPEGSRELFRVPLVLEAGSNSISVPLPELYDLVVHVPGADRRSWVTLRLRQGKNLNYLGQKRLDEQGNAVFHDLIPGEYSLSYRGSGKKAEITLSIPQQTEVTLIPTE